MNKPTLVLLGVLAALMLITSVVLAAWLGMRNSTRQGPWDLQSFVNEVTASVTPAPATPNTDVVPDLTLAVLEPYREEWGDPLRLRAFVGRTPVVVNVWASWCVPCRREASLLEAAWREYRGRIQFVGVNYRDGETAALAFVREYGLSFPTGADPTGDVANAFGLVGLPTTYFIDPGGRIRAANVGELTEDLLDGYLQALLPTRTP